jgi:hypothetical protein
MMKRVVFRVLPITENKKLTGWRVVIKGANTFYLWHEGGYTKKDAIKLAVSEAKANQPSQLFIHKRDGKIAEERTYPRSSDSRRHKG